MQLSPFSVLNTGKLVAGDNGGRSVANIGLFTGPARLTLAAKSDAGTTPTLAVKLQNAPAKLRVPEFLGAGNGALKSRTASAVAVGLAASFTVAATTTVESIYLPLKKNGTVASGTLTLALQADTAGDPSDTDLITATSAAADVSATGSNVKFTFANPYDLVAGDYWIELTSDVTAHSENNIEWRSTTVASGGNAAQFDEAWAGADTHNLEHWSDSYVFADVAGAAFTTVAAVGVTQTIQVLADPLAFIRSHITVAGTSVPAYYAAVSGIGQPD